MSNIIEIKGLTKRYDGLLALNDLNLTIGAGEVFGFIGPNGAGKTTTMRIITTLLEATRGEAHIAGYSVRTQPRDVRRVIGYMPDFFGVYDDMKVWEYLDFFAACYDIPANTRKTMIGDLLDLVDLGHKREEQVESLSRGMKQRLCLARTLAHDPQVLILDEPASGLDPRARIEIRELLRALQQMGKTIFFSSHILSEVADICTSIGIMEGGQLVAFGNMGDMRRRLQQHRLVQVRVLGENTAVLQDLLFRHPLVHEFKAPAEKEPEPEQAQEQEEDPTTNTNNTIRFDFTGDDAELSELLRHLVNQNIPILSFGEEESDLEDVFMQLTRGLVS